MRPNSLCWSLLHVQVVAFTRHSTAQFDVVLVSPSRRALQTAQILLAHTHMSHSPVVFVVDCPRHVSDIPAGFVALNTGTVDLDLPETHQLAQRCTALLHVILDRPEQKFLVVSHAAYFRALLTGGALRIGDTTVRLPDSGPVLPQMRDTPTVRESAFLDFTPCEVRSYVIRPHV